MEKIKSNKLVRRFSLASVLSAVASVSFASLTSSLEGASQLNEAFKPLMTVINILIAIIGALMVGYAAWKVYEMLSTDGGRRGQILKELVMVEGSAAFILTGMWYFPSALGLTDVKVEKGLLLLF